jgi:predicted homoserine dehydrogenase-like protein
MDNLLLSQLTKRERPIRVGIAGAGRFSIGLMLQTVRMKGMRIVALYDPKPEFAIEAYLLTGYRREEIRIASSPAAVQAAIESGRPVIAEDAFHMLSCDIDVIVDSTGRPVFGAEFAYQAILNKKHVVMVNIETDVGIGSVLRWHAEREGVVYTLADGDQPSLAKGLYDWAQTLGLEVPVLGKWMTVHSEEEIERRLSRKDGMRDTDAAYWDGSKYQIEMACIANMTGYTPDVPGMHKPRAELAQIPSVFRLKEDGGILSRTGVVDVVDLQPTGDMNRDHLNGGVFIIISSPDALVRKQLAEKGIPMSPDLSCGIIYRSHHLVGVETPISIAKAVVFGEATGAPRVRPTADVVAVAKRDIKAGDTLDGMGGELVRGVIVEAVGASDDDGLPYALAQNVKARVPIPKGTIITYGMLQERGNDPIWRLRAMQDGMSAL